MYSQSKLKMLQSTKVTCLVEYTIFSIISFHCISQDTHLIANVILQYPCINSCKSTPAQVTVILLTHTASCDVVLVLHTAVTALPLDVGATWTVALVVTLQANRSLRVTVTG